MKIMQKLLGIAAVLCFGVAHASAAGHTFNLSCLATGNWNSAGHRTSSNYQIGYSTELPNEQADYFEFNLSSVTGKTITSANMLIIGSTDYSINSWWGSHNEIAFKVRCAAQCNPAYPITLSQMLTGQNSTITYTNMSDFNRNVDLGYGWVTDGLHPGFRFDCFHYESVGIGEGGKTVGPWLQNEANAGGDWCMVTYSGYDLNEAGQRPSENYIWGGTSFTSSIQLQVITSN